MLFINTDGAPLLFGVSQPEHPSDMSNNIRESSVKWSVYKRSHGEVRVMLSFFCCLFFSFFLNSHLTRKEKSRHRMSRETTRSEGQEEEEEQEEEEDEHEDEKNKDMT